MDVVREILSRLDVLDVLRCKSICKSWYNLISTNCVVKAHLKHSYIFVVEDILARLDVKDVSRCKCICKLWYKLISSNYFAKAHLKSSYNNNREHGYLRIQLHRMINNYTELPYCMMVGSCDGLVCISPIDGKLLVTNPSTREVRKLPNLPYNSRFNVCWGFGYDFSTDDYKVVVGFNESEHHMRFQVLSLKSNQWKIIGEIDTLTYYTLIPGSGVLYDGALHWLVYDTKEKKTVLLSFDLSLEKFKEIPQPCDYPNTLGTFEECLCIVGPYNSISNSRDTWVMNKYGCWQMLPCDYKGDKYADATTVYLLHVVKDHTWRLRYGDKENVDMSWQRLGIYGTPIQNLFSGGHEDKKAGSSTAVNVSSSKGLFQRLYWRTVDKSHLHRAL
ncbi:F-box/kelch-repeat protein At3g23880-like [Rutidosis leptorrhynchoides]|uniref:F-box/kelch-repeat protein At3g23880-like n=1 Tax=Rutidosis leptorrhynchoides TaxID=125765 RepID=UPI003A999B99